MRRTLPLLLALAALPVRASAQPADSTHATTSAYRHEGAPQIRAARVKSGEIHVDGSLSEAAWAAATPFTQFTQIDPNEGQPASEATEVRVLIDDDALYIGARLHDREPARIRGKLARRDEGCDSDLLQVNLDTYHDHLTSVFFRLNPVGALRDGVSAANGNDDTSWDPVWQGAASIDSGGWTAEMRIPLSQLHYNNVEDAVWGIQFERLIHRKQERDLFAFTPKKEEGGVSRYGHLVGLGHLGSQRHFEILPYTLARAEYTSVSKSNPFRSGKDYFGAAGLDLKYGLTSDLTLAGSINPDFGQAEVDPAVVNLTASETFYPEKRPFFVEGSDNFSFGNYRSFNNFGFGQLFYTRRIGRPPHRVLNGFSYTDAPNNSTIAAATKVTGKTRGGWTVGMLDAVTSRETARFLDDGGVRGATPVEPLTNFLVTRLRRDADAGNTSVGAIVTAVNRRLEDSVLEDLVRSSAYMGGVDFSRLWADKHWALSGFFTGSYVRGSESIIAATQRSSARYFQRPGQTYLHYDPTRTSLSGTQSTLALARINGTHWLGSLTYQDMSPGFEVNDLGYETRADRRTFSTIALYKEDRPGKLFRNYSIFPFTYHAWNYGGQNITAGYALALQGTMANFWWGDLRFTASPSVHDDQRTRGGPVMRTADGGNVQLQLHAQLLRLAVLEQQGRPGLELLGHGELPAAAGFTGRAWPRVRPDPLRGAVCDHGIGPQRGRDLRRPLRVRSAGAEDAAHVGASQLDFLAEGEPAGLRAAAGLLGRVHADQGADRAGDVRLRRLRTG